MSQNSIFNVNTETFFAVKSIRGTGIIHAIKPWKEIPEILERDNRAHGIVVCGIRGKDSYAYSTLVFVTVDGKPVNTLLGREKTSFDEIPDQENRCNKCACIIARARAEGKKVSEVSQKQPPMITQKNREVIASSADAEVKLDVTFDRTVSNNLSGFSRRTIRAQVISAPWRIVSRNVYPYPTPVEYPSVLRDVIINIHTQDGEETVTYSGDRRIHHPKSMKPMEGKVHPKTTYINPFGDKDFAEAVRIICIERGVDQK